IAPLILAPHNSIGAIVTGRSPILWLIPAAILGIVMARFAPNQAFGTAAALAGLGFLWFQFATFPAFDALASARPFLSANTPQCAPPLPRETLYGLYYYAGGQISDCPVLDRSGTRVVR